MCSPLSVPRMNEHRIFKGPCQSIRWPNGRTKLWRRRLALWSNSARLLGQLNRSHQPMKVFDKLNKLPPLVPISAQTPREQMELLQLARLFSDCVASKILRAPNRSLIYWPPRGPNSETGPNPHSLVPASLVSHWSELSPAVAGGWECQNHELC